MISSEAGADKNKISTETLTWSDLKNEAEWESKTSGINVNIPGKSKEQEKTEKETGVKLPKGKDHGITPNFSGSDGEDDSTTKSGISEGTIEIRDEKNQKQDIEDLNRDTTNTNDPLDKIFDKDKILEKEQAAALFGEIGFEAIGKLIHAKEQSKEWEPGDPRAIALHALVGGIMAEINGGGFGEGMTTAAINKLIISKLADSGLVDGAELRWISAALGYALSGAEGAALADSATRNNENYTSAKEGMEKMFELDSPAFLFFLSDTMGLTDADVSNLSSEEREILLGFFETATREKFSKHIVREQAQRLMEDFSENAIKNFALGYLAVHSAGMSAYLKGQGMSSSSASETVILYAGAATFAGVTMVAYDNMSEGAKVLDPRRYLKGEVKDYLIQKGVEIYDEYVEKIVSDALTKIKK